MTIIDWLFILQVTLALLISHCFVAFFAYQIGRLAKVGAILDLFHFGNEPDLEPEDHANQMGLPGSSEKGDK
jgi:hypothetical protein